MLGGGEELFNPLLIRSGVTSASNDIYTLLIVTDDGERLWLVGEPYLSGVDYTETLIDITSYLQLRTGETIVMTTLLGEEAFGVVTSLGRVLVWGEGWSGLLGTGNTNAVYRPVDITSNFAGLTDSTYAYVDSVSFGGVPATSYELLDDHTLLVVVPPGTHTGPVDITIDGSAPQTIAHGYEYVNELCVR
jgi:hypothetical protein